MKLQFNYLQYFNLPPAKKQLLIGVFKMSINIECRIFRITKRIEKVRIKWCKPNILRFLVCGGSFF